MTALTVGRYAPYPSARERRLAGRCGRRFAALCLQ
jgi:hypothetical protein